MPLSFENFSRSLNAYDNGKGQWVGKSLPDWTPRLPLPDVVLQGRICRVEPFKADLHGEPLFKAFNSDDGSMWCYMPFGPFADLNAYLDETLRRIETGGFQTFVIRCLASEQPLGQASYMRYDLANGSVEIGGIAFSPALKRSSVATEAMYLMMRHAFEHGYRRYEWKCDQLNRASNRAALRLGFTFEGIFRNAVVYKGRRRDTCWYSVITEDWPMIRERLEAWLDPSNFDDNGQQKLSLSSLPVSEGP